MGLFIPTGYSFNLDGTTIYLSMSVIFLAQVFQIDLSLGQQLVIIGILLITSKGAAGVTGSWFYCIGFHTNCDENYTAGRACPADRR